MGRQCLRPAMSHWPTWVFRVIIVVVVVAALMLLGLLTVALQ